MPELPDVEVYKRRLEADGLGKRIETVHVADARLLEDVSASTLRRRLKGHCLTNSRRHGKLLFAGLDEGPYHLVMHFGMTGFLDVVHEDDDVPGYSAIVLDYADGGRLAYASRRKLGHVGLTDDVDDYLRRKKLGVDALDEALDLEGFRRLLGEGAGSVKGALMNQSKIAGIGNVYSDEVLLRARVHPATPVDQLDASATRALFRAMGDVLNKAIEAGAQPERMPRSFLLPERSPGAPCPVCGGPIEKRRIGGRSSFFCPSCQAR